MIFCFWREIVSKKDEDLVMKKGLWFYLDEEKDRAIDEIIDAGFHVVLPEEFAELQDTGMAYPGNKAKIATVVEGESLILRLVNDE